MKQSGEGNLGACQPKRHKLGADDEEEEVMR